MSVLSKLIAFFTGSRSETVANAPTKPVLSTSSIEHSQLVNEWIASQKKSKPKNKRANPAARKPIDSVSFSYMDRDGKRSVRTVDVFSSDDEYFEGFCHSRFGTRTFKASRVMGKVTSIDTGEVMNPQAWLHKIYNASTNTHVIVGNEQLHQKFSN